MKQFLEYLVKKIVDFPEQVSVEEVNEMGLINLNLSVAQQDMGKVIGKEGRVIRSIRDLVRILAVKNNLKVNVSLKEQ